MEQTDKQKKFQQVFIEKAKELHPNKNYDYSKVIYKKSSQKVEIICPIHGSFFQKPNDHNSLRHPQNCPICGGCQKSNIDEFIKKAKKIHGQKYDYREAVYVDCKTKMKIFCKEHKKIFLQNANNHLQGQGCPCGKNERTGIGNLKLNKQTFIAEAVKIHKDRFDYSLIVYKDIKKLIKIICKEHNHVFEQSPDSHLRSKWCCPLCIEEQKKMTKKKTTKEFIEEAKKVHGDKYKYDEVEYISNNKKIKIYCKKHKNYFYQLPRSHISSKAGCPVCSLSKGEIIIREILLKNKIKFEQQKLFKECKLEKLLRFDFFLPEFKTIIEYNGKQHYEKINHFYKKNDTFDLRKKRDEIKKKFAEENGFIFLEIPYWVKSEDIEGIIIGFCNNA